MMTIRDLITQAADMANVANMDAPLSARESVSYLNLLKTEIMKLRLRNLTDSGLKSWVIPWSFPTEANWFDVKTYKDLPFGPDEVPSQYAERYAAKEPFALIEEEYSREQRSCVYFPKMILKPSSVSMGLPNAPDGQRVPIEEMDQASMLQTMNTLNNNVSYPRYWAWSDGAVPRIWVNGTYIKPQSIVLNVCLDEFTDVDFDDDISGWRLGLDEILKTYLAYQISASVGMPDDRLLASAKQMQQTYEESLYLEPSYRVDASAPVSRRGSWPWGSRVFY